MRTEILALEFRLMPDERYTEPLTEYDQYHRQALVSLELLIDFGHLLGALPEDKGNEIWSEKEASHRLETLSKSLNGLGKLAAALADHAYASVQEMDSSHVEALKQLEQRSATRKTTKTTTTAANG